MNLSYKFEEVVKLFGVLRNVFLGYFEETAIKPQYRLLNLNLSKYHNPSKKIYDSILDMSSETFFKETINLSSKLLGKSTISENEYISLQVNSYFELNTYLEAFNFSELLSKKNITFKSIKEWKINFKDKELMKKILFIKETLSKSSLVKEIILISSFSTLDYILGWSDVDIVVVLKQDHNNYTSSNIKDLKKYFLLAEKKLYEIDPLQHHSFFIMFELEFKFYSESYFLPLAVFEKSVPLLDKFQKKELKVKNYIDKSKEKFISRANQYIDFSNNNFLPKNQYELKDLVSFSLNLPFMYLQAKGQYTYKKDAFTIAPKKLKSKYWNAIMKWSRIRLQWKLNKTFFTSYVIYSTFFFNFLKKNSLRQMFFKIFYEPLPKNIIGKKELSFLLKDTAQLLNEMKESLRVKNK